MYRLLVESCFTSTETVGLLLRYGLSVLCYGVTRPDPQLPMIGHARNLSRKDLSVSVCAVNTRMRTGVGGASSNSQPYTFIVHAYILETSVILWHKSFFMNAQTRYSDATAAAITDSKRQYDTEITHVFKNQNQGTL